MDEDKKDCPVCNGYGKLYDPVHTWAHVQCHACDGTGTETEWHIKLRTSYFKEKCEE